MEILKEMIGLEVRVYTNFDANMDAEDEYYEGVLVRVDSWGVAIKSETVRDGGQVIYIKHKDYLTINGTQLEEETGSMSRILGSFRQEEEKKGFFEI